MAFSNHDIVPDSPTNNFATLNSLVNAGSTISENNLKISFGNDGSFNPPVETSTFTIPSSGKWYFEGLLVSSTAMGIGIQANTDVRVRRNSVEYGIYYLDSGNIYTYVNGSGTIVDSTPASFTTGDIIGVAYDANTNSISWYKNGVLQTSNTPSTGYDFTPALYAYDSTVMVNFGQDPTFVGNKTPSGGTNSDGSYPDKSDTGIGGFFYEPPAGSLALCAANLPEMTPNVGGDGPEDYFKAVLYTGNGTSQSITGVGFQPDFVWVKSRNDTTGHRLFDIVRGDYNFLESNSINAESNNTNQISLDADGFTTGSSTNTNSNGNTYVGWCWKAGGAPTADNSNTSGAMTANSVSLNGTLQSNYTPAGSPTIYPTRMSINTNAGFSIVKYTGTGSTGGTVPHGLDKKPDIVIIKNLDDGTKSWNITSFITTPSTVLTADTFDIGSKTGGVSALNLSNVPNAYTIDGQTSGSGGNHIAYCWYSVEGFSKLGSYTGNGSTDGPFVYTGFRVGWLMVKRTDASGAWVIQDNARSPYNVVDAHLLANAANSESSGLLIDYLSNGFKIRVSNTYTDYNATSGSYIFMAFAEQPFNYANAR